MFYFKSYFEVKDKYIRGISVLPIRRLNRRLRRGARKESYTKFSLPGKEFVVMWYAIYF